MNLAHKKLLNSFDRLISFLNKHHLKWFADGGTLLGVVRDGKMIEWDDDIDIMMPRKDFDNLSSLMHVDPRQIKGCFFQDPVTDPEYFNIHARLRIDGTTCISKREIHLKSHKGMFIDIYPFDHIYNNEAINAKIIKSIRNLCKGTDVEDDKPLNMKYTLPETTYRIIQTKLKRMDHNARYNGFQEQLVFPACFWRYSKYCNMKLHASSFSYALRYKMQGLRHKVNVPNGYEEVLELWYGEWEKPNHEASFHDNIAYDPTKGAS